MKQEKAYKIKLVKILEILQQDSDEDHYIETSEILNKLFEMGIKCDRRTLYNDIAVLNEYGYEVLCEKQAGKSNRYCVADRGFDVPELRILIDAINAASFVTPKKSEKLIDKIAVLGGSHRAELLKRNITWLNIAKHTNEQIYYTIDKLDRAISESKKVSFYYFKYDAQGNKVYRKDKKRYIENPYALVFSNEKYYLVSYNQKHDSILHYRVDRMDSVTIEDINRILPPRDIEFDLTAHMNQVFDMFKGEEKAVTINIDDNLIDVVRDKFGESIKFEDLGNGRCRTTIRVQVSPLFYSWCCSFPNRMEIVAPLEVVGGMKELIASLDKQYCKEKETDNL